MTGSSLCLSVQQGLYWSWEPLLTDSAVASFYSAHRSTTVVTPDATWNVGGPSSARNFLCLLHVLLLNARNWGWGGAE